MIQRIETPKESFIKHISTMFRQNHTSHLQVCLGSLLRFVKFNNVALSTVIVGCPRNYTPFYSNSTFAEKIDTVLKKLATVTSRVATVNAELLEQLSFQFFARTIREIKRIRNTKQFKA